MGSRDIQKGLDVRLDFLSDLIIQEANPRLRVTILDLDLAHFNSVVDFATKVSQTSHRLDLVVLFAGINLGHFEKSNDGHELCVQVNVLSNTFMSLLLLPKVLATAQDHFGSMGQAFHSLMHGPPAGGEGGILNYMASPKSFSPLRRYPDTKLFVSLIVRKLGSELSRLQQDRPNPAVIVNCVCPGTICTGADNNLPFWMRIPMNLNRALRASSNGYYVADNQIQELPQFANSPRGNEFSEKLWTEILSLGKMVDIEISLKSLSA
ncbi:NAD(P)-binding protein [Xylaria longipes]|nr:NAD(P)-binding protein [Xylaria longipes]